MRLSLHKKDAKNDHLITFDRLPDEYIRNEFPEEWQEREKQRVRSLYYYLPIPMN